ncbi:MAG: DUF2283 domain-containing protein [Actinomycetota bacterium]|nr:DUF2283 domain-containing protein [Actinomycetota bacterium]
MSIILRDEEIAESDEIKEGVIIDYSREGKIVSIEIVDASEQITDPKGISYELKGEKRISA